MIDLNKIISDCGKDKVLAIKTLRSQMQISLNESKEIIDAAYDMKKQNSKANVNILIRNEQKILSNQNKIYVGNKKSNNQIEYGELDAVWNSSSTKILKYQREIMHKGLKEHKIISAPDVNILKNKEQMQIEKWEENWKDICKKKSIEDIKKSLIDEACSRTLDAEMKLKEIEDILLFSLNVSSQIDWETLKDKSKFNKPYPERPSDLKLLPLPVAPDKESAEFQPKFGIMSNIFKSLKQKAIAEAETLYKIAYDKWKYEYENKVQKNNDITQKYNNDIKNFERQVKNWEEEKKEYDFLQTEYNLKIDEQRDLYMKADPKEIKKYCELVLSRSILPDFIDKDFEIEYNSDNKILIIDYMLPNINAFPNIKEVKYIASKNEIKETYFNDLYMEKLFDSTVYKLLLRFIHEEFEADTINALNSVSFNGWINFLDKATGKHEDACIVSILVNKNDFINIDLKNVDPKTCFKSLKGIGSSKLAGITPIKPILTINRNDKRFISSHSITNAIDDRTNLAAIPWEEFEHLIREVFEAEFSVNGGEAKVTQASRDGGVDVIAFDPDPIRGGKIVIQAKRYTNTVGVSAVRDLYGTVLNEGAIKGILVTTADYGPDAYEFAKNKPITLMNGGNLLYLLEKQGHRAKIDLKEAKIINNS